MSGEVVISCRGLHHAYSEKPVLHGVDLRIESGGITGLLGKNGAGKSTIINILMGFLRPGAGECRVLGHPSHAIPPAARRDIGLLHEGFIQYDYMSIEEIERFYAPLYPRWNRSRYFDLVGRLNVPFSRRISRLSCGQRSQVVLGLILAQQPRLMILDDYSMGLDVGYRRLFLELLRDHVRTQGTTALLTSHVVQELESLVDDVIILQAGRVLIRGGREEFMRSFRRFNLPLSEEGLRLTPDACLLNIERHPDSLSLYTKEDRVGLESYLAARGVPAHGLSPAPMSFEDAFIGITGRY